MWRSIVGTLYTKRKGKVFGSRVRKRMCFAAWSGSMTRHYSLVPSESTDTSSIVTFFATADD